jgi:hypothetical protein
MMFYTRFGLDYKTGMIFLNVKGVASHNYSYDTIINNIYF